MLTRTFTVTIGVTENWILDGFSFKPERVRRIIRTGMETELPYAYDNEINVTVEEQP
jgi:hypothetical protein